MESFDFPNLTSGKNLFILFKGLFMSGKFGGNWTIKKLNTLRDYLISYKKIFDANPKARHLRTHYIDAFAGEGDLVFGYSTEETLFDIPTNHP